MPHITPFRRFPERTTFQLPQGRAGPALGHTLASHVVMNGGNNLTFQIIRGMPTLTVRYVHLPSDDIQNVVHFVPVVGKRSLSLEFL